MEVIGVPFDLCGKREGSRLGPAAMRIAGLASALAPLNIVVVDGGDIPVQQPCLTDLGGLSHFTPALDAIRTLKARVLHSINSGDTPLVIGGDHFMAAGSVAAALEACDGEVALLWLDAHADLNTP